MKAKDVLKFLDITRVTLSHYVKNGKIKVIKNHNGYYDYDPDDVLSLRGLNVRKNVIYSRVSTKKQSKDLQNQIVFLEEFCKKNKIHIDEIKSEIGSGMSFDRIVFTELLNEITSYKIRKIVISDKDRLTRSGFSCLSQLCNKFQTEIVIANNTTTDSDVELLQEITSLIHTYSMKMYSSRRKKRMKIIEDSLELDGEE